MSTPTRVWLSVSLARSVSCLPWDVHDCPGELTETGDLKQHPPQNLLLLTLAEKRDEMAKSGLIARGKAHTTVQLSWPPGWALAPASCCSLAGL